MDIQKYIASGILEEYALGSVSEAEAQEVEQNIQQYPEIKAALHRIEDALAAYAQAKAVPMPTGLSEQILQTIEGSNPSSSDTTTKLATKNTSTTASSKTLGIVLGVALLGSLASNFYQYQQQTTVQSQLQQATNNQNELNNRLTTLQLECAPKDQKILQLEETIRVLNDPNYRAVLMKGTDKAPQAIAKVYYNPTASKSYLDLGNLPTTPTDRDYQLWAIVDGKPTDMGVIDLNNSNGFIAVAHILNVQAFAITLETKGGNPTPNLEALYVIGNV